MKNTLLPANLKCVIFDMDGVLYDSLKNHETTWRGSFKPEGIDFPAYDAYLHEGRPGHETVAAVFKQFLKKEATQEDRDRVYNEKVRLMNMAPRAEILPKMVELNEMLRAKGIQTRVVTGSKQPVLLSRLKDDFGFEQELVISAKDVKKGKPHPEPYLKAVEKSGFKAEECLVVENAPLGVKAAKAAGIFTIAVNTGVLEDEVLANAGADIVLSGTEPLYGKLSEYFAD